jgi:RND family efflux transporter MFP subunit
MASFVFAGFGVGRPLALALAVWALAACSRPEPPPEPVRAVKVMTVAPTEAAFAHEFAGEVRARSEVRLGFRVAGKLIARPAEVGQLVRPGQVLAQLDGTDYQLAAQSADAQLRAAQTQRDLAAADLKRFTELKAQQFISAAELERRETAMKAAQATLEQAQAQAKAQVNQRAYTTLVAEQAGVVVAVEAEPGQVLSAGAPVLRVAQGRARDVVVSLPEQLVGRVRVGQPVQVRLWAGGASHAASVREVAASADPVSRTFAVKLALPESASDANLGVTAFVRWQPLAQAAGAPPVIKLPTSALWADGQTTAVWLYDPALRQVKRRTVVLAAADGNQAVVASGLQGGEQVVVAGVHVLSDGQTVTLFQPKNEQKMPLAHDLKGFVATEKEASAVPVPASAPVATSAAPGVRP